MRALNRACGPLPFARDVPDSTRKKGELYPFECSGRKQRRSLRAISFAASRCPLQNSPAMRRTATTTGHHAIRALRLRGSDARIVVITAHLVQSSIFELMGTLRGATGAISLHSRFDTLHRAALRLPGRIQEHCRANTGSQPGFVAMIRGDGAGT